MLEAMQIINLLSLFIAQRYFIGLMNIFQTYQSDVLYESE
jgi:hypothetical protein